MVESHISAAPRTDANTAPSAGSGTPDPDDAPTRRYDPDGPARSSGWATRQRVAAATVLAFAVLVTVTSHRYGLSRGTQPGPGLFPFIIGALLVVLSLAWLFKPGRPEAEEPTDPVGVVLEESEQEAAEAHVEEEIDWGHGGAFRFGATLLVTAVAIGLFVSVGYTVAVAFYTAALLVIVARQKPLWSIAGAVLGAMLTRALFDYLGIVLPSLPVEIPFLPWAVL